MSVITCRASASSEPTPQRLIIALRMVDIPAHGQLMFPSSAPSPCRAVLSSFFHRTVALGIGERLLLCLTVATEAY
jgi:hypothetical protein